MASRGNHDFIGFLDGDVASDSFGPGCFKFVRDLLGAVFEGAELNFSFNIFPFHKIAVDAELCM